MNENRTTRIWASIAQYARGDGDSISLRHVCLACADTVSVDFAAVALASTMSSLEPVFATDSRGDRLEEMQGTVGEGPGLDAVATASSVLIDDLASRDSVGRWPAFTAGALRLGVGAMFSLPLAVGAIQVGVLDLYRGKTGDLTADELADAFVFADIALMTVLDRRSGIERSIGPLGDGAEVYLRRAIVHQAAGIMSVQLGIPVLDALVRLRAHAYARDQQLATVARAVVERRLRFAPEDETPTGATQEGS